ncbi:MAG: hypothetical protein RMX68_031465 [Aulosira sp. ZfuVER01]|nr:hypothetical protein [Aulosira sp. ZfuVER01]MDZ7998348.1 hypothetical protein [Aulosira sp. DedVER01a]MDZ8050125.1 hypothetical protein [Aulosira sp. ZfuCHP01]
MDNIKNWLGAGVTLALMSATIAPAAAQSVMIINGVVKEVPNESSVTYSSPIATPVPLNQTESAVTYSSPIAVPIPLNQTQGSYIYSSPVALPVPLNQTQGSYIYNGPIATPIPLNQTESSYIYISPIATPIPINRVTKHIPSNSNFYYHRHSNYYRPRTTIYSYPPYPQTIINPNLTYPNMVNPIFRNAPLRNPVFEERSRYQEYRQPFRGRTRGIRIYPR